MKELPMPFRRAALFGLAACALALASPPPPRAFADDDAEAPEPTTFFIDRVEVNLVDVEVFVTDRQGRRVTDLTRDDFEVRVDGRPVEITNFFAAAAPAETVATGVAGDLGGLRVAPPTTLAPPAAAPSPAAAEPAASEAAVARERRLNLMVYVDHGFIQPANRKRLLDHLRGFLAEGLDEHTWVMLVGYNGAVEVAAPLTRDREELAAGLERLGAVAGGAGPLSMDRVMTVLNNTPEDLDVGTLVSSFIQQEEAKLRLSIRALGESLALFAGLPGRKAVLHVSDGLPMEVMAAVQALTGEGGFPSTPGLRQGERLLYQQLVRAAQAHQIAFYPVDSRGPVGQDYTSAEFAALDGLSLEGAPMTNAGLGAMETINRQEPLLEMAAATGGTAILNTYNFEKALDQVAVDFASFYSLGFAAPHAGDGRRHAIDVRVKRPGLRVRHREGYVDKPLVERVGDRTLSFLHLAMESNPLGLEIGLGTPRRDGRRWVLPVLVRVPAEAVTLLPGATSRDGRLHVFLAVRDDRGRVSDLTHLPHPLAIPLDETAPDGGDLGIGVNLAVRPGRWTLAVGVWDEIGGGESYVRETVDLVEPEPERRGRRSR